MEFDTFMMSPQQLHNLFSDDPDEREILSSTGGAHYSCGGIKVGTDRCSSLAGLYAAGEVAGGTFGSARPGGSAIGDIIVSGYWAGRSAAESASGEEWNAVEEGQVAQGQVAQGQVAQEESRLQRLLGGGGLDPGVLKREIREIMWRGSGPVRRENGLHEALEELGRLREESSRMGVRNPAQLRDAVEVELMLDVGEIVAAAALERRESRGTHWRLDYPRPDNGAWLKNVVICRGRDGRPKIEVRPVQMARARTAGPCKIGSRWTWGYVRR
jgi:succinate dehydrogenase/fumarate reductase flavoprotein subunit